MALTDTQLRGIKPTGQRFERKDRDGLGIRVSSTGVITFQATPVLSGKRIRIKYGNYPALGLKAARDKHGEALELLAAGIDPRTHWQNIQQAERTAVTVKELCDEWYQKYALQNRKRPGDALAILKANIFPAIGTLKAKDVVRRDVINAVNAILDRGSKAQAHRVLTLIKQVFSFGVQVGLLDFSPVAEVKPSAVTGQMKSRERVLSDEEIKATWLKLPDLGLSPPVVLALKLLLITAQRRGELANARWEHITLTGDSPVWKIPAEHAKNARAHQVPLSPLAVDLFRQLRDFSQKLDRLGEWVFPSYREGVPITEKSITRAVARKQESFTIDDQAIPHWTPHDLRRTAATKMAELNAQPYIVEKILNHSLEGVMAVYNRYDYMAERRDVLDAWSVKLQGLIKETDTIKELAE